MSDQRSPVEWLESPEGERWSSDHHRHAHAGDAYLPNHIASVRPAPGEDPVWDKEPDGHQFGPRDPRLDPAGGLPLGRRRMSRTTRPSRTARGSR